MNNKAFIKDLLVQTFITISSIFLLLFLLVELIPVNEISILVILIVTYILFIASYFIFNKNIYKITRNLNTLLSILIIMITVITLISSSLIMLDKEGIELIIKENNVVGEYIYFFICFIQPIFLPLPEPVTIVAGSAALGPLNGFIIGSLGTILGIITMFFIARIGGVEFAKRVGKQEMLNTYRKLIRKKETLILFALFMFPILPDEIIAIGAGLSSIKYNKFIIITIISKLITAYIYSYSIEVSKYFKLGINEWAIIIAVILIGVLLIRKAIYKKVDISKKQVN